jgi:redox-sensitive bicupin YhaK (pirin superfamily)
MSVETIIEHNQTELMETCSAIETLITPKKQDLGGFSVRRALPAVKRKMVGPWIFFDHMGPVSFSDGEGIDVRPHPHINLATVTYLFEGEMLHRDSLGNDLLIKPSEINLMVAGKGIVHSERQREEVKVSNNVLNGLQLWLALPEADEEMNPEFHHYDSSDIPSIIVAGVPVRVLIGSAFNVISPVKTFAETLYIEANLKAGQSLTLPDNVEERAVYVVKGQLSAKKSKINEYSMAVLQRSQTVTVTADVDTTLVMIGGEKLSKRHIWWNFVSSRKERIEQAKRDWTSGVFAKVYNDESDYIPLPEK